MANPWAGEVTVVLNGQAYVARLTLGALAELEAAMEAESLVDLVERFEQGRYTTRDVLGLIVAGLRGGGWCGTAEDLRAAEIAGGLGGAARLAAELLVRAFAPPDPAAAPK